MIGMFDQMLRYSEEFSESHNLELKQKMNLRNSFR